MVCRADACMTLMPVPPTPLEAKGARPHHGAGARDGVLIVAPMLLCLICWAGALNAMGKEFVVIAETDGRATAGRVRSCRWWFGGVVVVICYTI